MKKILLSCVAFAMAIVATAQNGSLKVTEPEFDLSQPVSSVKYQNNAKAIRAKLPANQRYMGNYSGKITLLTPVNKIIAENFNGGKVVGMRVALPADGIGAITAKLYTYNISGGDIE